MANLKLRFRRRGTWVISLVTLMLLSIATIPQVSAQSSGGFGVGSGDGTETGIRLDVLNQVKADIAAGVYDRPCTAAEHDPTKWHSLVNLEAKCHYDHQHGDDPNYVNDIFGDPGGWFQSPGQSISYPWQTFPAQTTSESNAAYLGTGKMENEAKHEGYYWIVRRDQPCNTANGQYCVKDFRVQYHGIMQAHGAAVRYHSMSAEVRVCRNVNDTSTCGIIRTGGWMEFGRLYVQDPAQDASRRALCGHLAGNQLQYIPLPVDNQYFPITSTSSLDEERCHPLLTPAMLAAGPRTGKVGDSPKAEWWAHGASDFRFQLQVANPIGNIYETAPGSGQLVNDVFCSLADPECQWNQSIMTMRLQYIVPINGYYVQGYLEPGRANLRLEDGRYITRFGGINANCTAPGLDCIPIEYNNIPMANGVSYVHTPCESCQKVDYDLSPAGQQWITWFYYKYGLATPGEETPPQPEEPTGPAAYFEVNNASADQVVVNLKLIDVDNIYGVQASCQVDPQVLQGTTMTPGDAFDPNQSFILDDGFQSAGSWAVAATRLKPTPAISGTALAFSLSYDVLASGDGQLACSALFVDENGQNVTLDVVNGTVIIIPPSEPSTEPVENPPVNTDQGGVSGQAVYQNHPDNAGITVKLVGMNRATLDEVVTGADGSFSFGDLPLGQYTVELLAPQHIPVVEDVNLEAADQTVQVSGQLRAGDVDDNGKVEINDVVLVSSNFGLQVSPEIQNFDLNADGWINISDLALTGGNLDLVSPLDIP